MKFDLLEHRGRIQGGGDTSSALRILPDKLKTELALHVNLATLKKVFRKLPRTKTLTIKGKGS